MKQSDGTVLDFNDEENRRRAKEYLTKERPRVLIGRPMRTYFSQLMRTNVGRVEAEEYDRRDTRAVSHLEFMCELYRQQLDQGGFILHEYPQGASSWNLPCMQELVGRPGHRATSVQANEMVVQ